MIKLLRTIFKSKYKWALFGSLGIAIVISFVYACWANNDFVEILVISILVSLLINLMSSFVTLIFIEERDKLESARIENGRQAVVLEKIVRAIRDYNNFFANMYKATSVDAIADLEKRCANIYYEIDILVEHLNRLGFDQDGYIAYYQPQAEIQRQLEQGIFHVVSYSWIEIFIDKTIEYIESIYSIQNSFLFCLNNMNIVSAINNIALQRDGLMKLRGYNNFEFLKQSPNVVLPENSGKCHLYPNGVKLKSAIIMLHTLDTIFNTKSLMTEIDNITGSMNFKIDPLVFTATNISPKIASGIDKKPIQEAIPYGNTLQNP